MKYNEALQYIHSVNWCFCKPGLERIGALCEKLGNPQDQLRFIHVAGTNGKGSFCAMMTSILRSSGHSVGTYTSPYVKVFNERMAINGENIGNDELAALTEEVKRYADTLDESPTEFELITAIAFLYFRRHNCDIVVLEVGMGGRLDATNIIKKSVLSVITGIALDHTAYLGDTVEKIAAEKSGIMKTGCPILYGGEDMSAEAVIRNKAKETGCPYNRTDYSKLFVRSATLDGAVFDFGERKEYSIPLLGLYQPKNASVVLSAVDILKKSGWNISEEAVKRGLSAVSWPARFEKLSKDPLVLYDGAHNPQGIEAAIKTLSYYFGDKKVYLLTGCMADKDYTEMAERLSVFACKVFTVTPSNPRSLDAKELAKLYLKLGVRSESFETVEKGYRAAYTESKQTGVPLVCLGSLYMYGEVYDASQKIK